MNSFRFILAALVICAGSAGWAQTGVITTIAGTTPPGGSPVRGFSGDGGPAVSATLALANVQNDCDPNRYEQMSHLTVDRSGNVYFADSNNQRIRRITPQGVITTVAGSGEKPPTNSRCEPTGGGAAVGDGGPPTSGRLFNPADLVVDRNANLLVADQQNNRIRQVTVGGSISTVVGNGTHNFYSPNIPVLTTPLDWPSSLALDPNGVLYFAELHSHRVGRITPEGRIATVAGTGFQGFGGDNGPATSARLFNPSGLTFDSQGNLYIADQSNHRIRKVTPDGTISTVAGTGQPGFSGDDGPATSAALNQPIDVKADANGNLYVADMANHRIRRVSPSGIITTVAGNGTAGRGADNVAATSSSLNFPAGVAVDTAGDLYITDWQNYLIRKVSFNPQPSITPGGVVNGASFAPAPVPVAPGSIISIFGVNLAASTALASELPLPTQLTGATVRINGTPAPLFFVSPGQINAQVPFDVAPGTATAVVTTAAGSSKSETFNVATSAAGIFQFPGTNRAVALNQDSSINGRGNPEARGNVLVVFLTGQGPVNPRVPTGQPAPFDTLSPATLPVGAQIGGAAANVLFLGLTPGFVGLAQANIRIPPGAVTGDDVVMFVSVDGQPGNTATVSIR